MPTTFADLGVPADLCAALERRGISEPFPIQAATIPDALAGRDLCGQAPTGSGKTLAFGLPLLASRASARSRRPRSLVLAPTRELAEQIARELSALAGTTGQRVLAVYGGVGYGAQRSRLARGVEILVACPGRLEDLLAQQVLKLDEVEQVVVDEADRMADMGFMPAVRRLLDATPSDRQTMLFSATLGGPVADLTKRYQRDPARHAVEAETDAGSAEHRIWKVGRDGRVDATIAAIRSHGSTIVFTRTRRGADRLVQHLAKRGVEAVAIHGGRNQNQRDRALAAFTRGRAEAMVATDVAARGIHVDDVACVVHHDPPEDADTYLHRSGRTGRAGATGVVISMVGTDGVRSARRMVESLGLTAEVDAAPAAGAALPSRRPSPAATTAPAAAAARRSTGRASRPVASRSPERVPEPSERRSSARASTRPPRHQRSGSGSGAETGTVKFFDRRKGYGFIEHERHGEVFVHHTNLVAAAAGLRNGQRVTFEISPGINGRRSQAAKVRPA